MATGTGKVLCRYFMSGCCKNGIQCPFSHDWTDKPDMTCRFYLQGQCVYGSKCRYDHVKPKLPTEQKQSSSGPVSLPSTSSSGHSPQTDSGGMVTLTKDPSRNPKKWAQAAEFVPGKFFHGPAGDLPTLDPYEPLPAAPQPAYSEMAGGESSFLDVITSDEAAGLILQLCPFAEMGECPFGDSCEYLHGDLCDMCNRECLNPYDPEQQKAHKKECLEMHEREMERAFQIQETEGKRCAICLEYVSKKPVRNEQRFGILPNCSHCFCLSCIRKWRQTTHTQKRTIRACPLCRMVSYFVIPSEVWIDDPDQKAELMGAYKGNLSNKHCKYFNMGKGTCSFGSSCFYKHEYPDGTVAKDDPRYLTDADGARKPISNSTLWDFFSDREERSLIAQSDFSWDETSSNNEDEVPRHILEDMFGDRDWFWSTHEPEANEFDDIM